jgi:hypothetical protein
VRLSWATFSRAPEILLWKSPDRTEKIFVCAPGEEGCYGRFRAEVGRCVRDRAGRNSGWLGVWEASDKPYFREIMPVETCIASHYGMGGRQACPFLIHTAPDWIKPASDYPVAAWQEERRAVKRDSTSQVLALSAPQARDRAGPHPIKCGVQGFPPEICTGRVRVVLGTTFQSDVYAPVDIEASFKHQRVVDCILQILL